MGVYACVCVCVCAASVVMVRLAASLEEGGECPSEEAAPLKGSVQVPETW